LTLPTIKARNQELSEKADDERRRCRDWLLPFMRDNQPKFLTKNELRAAELRNYFFDNADRFFMRMTTIRLG